jgi:exodeoxyribonuclease VII small subunit
MATTRGGGKSAAGAGSDATGVGDLSYSDAGAELDAIIEEFETGVIDVDRLVDQLQRATEIVDELDRRLRRTRMQVEELVPRLEAIGQRDVTDEDADDGGTGPDGAGPSEVGGRGTSQGLF